MSTIAAPFATVVVSPRDAFTHAMQCLHRLLECTPAPRRIVYVDGGSPASLARELEACAVAEDFALLRSDCVLTPNHARNLALDLVRAGYEPGWTAFVDNDAYVEPGWLERLRECGEETGAVAVVPLLSIGLAERRRIHVAGGDSAILEEDGVRRFEESHPYGNEPVHPAREQMSRRPCGLFEFHCVLVRTPQLRAVAPLDEGLPSLLEHVDLGFALRQQGAEVWFEPDVEVTYLPGKINRGDGRRYFVTRWSEERNQASVDRFRENWQLPVTDPEMTQYIEFGAWMRAHAYRPYRSPFVRRTARHGRYPRSLIDRIAQRDARRWYRRQVAASGPPRVVHRPSWLETPVDV